MKKATTTTPRPKKPKSNQAIVLDLVTRLSPGDSFITDSSPREVTGAAYRLLVKVTTSNCILIENYLTASPKLTKVTRVTIL